MQQVLVKTTLRSIRPAIVQPSPSIHFLCGQSVKCEPQTAVAQPWDARINASIFEFRIEVGQDRRGSRLVLKAVNDDVDDIAAQLHPPLDTVDELAMDQFRRLLLIGRSEVMTEVVHHVEREETERQHGLDRVEIQGWEMVHSQERVLRKEVLNAPPFRVGRHGGVRGHGTGGRDQGEVLAVAALLQEHPQRAVEVGHGRIDGRHIAPDSLVILLQRDGVKLPQAFGDDLTGVKTATPYWAWSSWISCPQYHSLSATSRKSRPRMARVSPANRWVTWETVVPEEAARAMRGFFDAWSWV